MKLFYNILLYISIILTAAGGYCEDRGIHIKKTAQERRIALVIGNADYQYAGTLKNPLNDAEDVAQILRELGFQVISKNNASLNVMSDAVYQFGELLKGGGIGLFYFSGHGMQVKGENYLLPVEADIQREDQIRYKALNANDVLSKMDEAKSHLNLIFLDACRNDPFPRGFRSSVRGLADMKAPAGTLLIYATNPGNTASDGTERNSPYTKNLLRYIREPDLEVGMMLRKIRTAVREETEGKQVPWETGSMEGVFYFNTEGYKPADSPLEIDATETNNIKSPKNGEWFVVLASFPKTQDEQAKERVNFFKLSGYEAYIVDTDNFSNLTKGLWVIVMGPYSKSHAMKVKNDLHRLVSDAYIKIAE